MRFQRLSAVLIGGGLAFLTGCPFGPGFLDDLLQDGTSRRLNPDVLIPDGDYTGVLYSTAEFWQAGEAYWQGDWPRDYARATFVEGEFVNDAGYWLGVGDVDAIDLGTIQLEREVYSEDVFDWGYEAIYDVTGTWKGVPVVGVQHIDFYPNEDGTVSMYESIELNSAEWFDGGSWVIEIESESLMAPGSINQPVPDSIPDDILDKKSGKIRR
jgi:hypothetical protein